MAKKNGKRTLNAKEQALLSALVKGNAQRTIKELKMLFMNDAKARLLHDYEGWTDKDVNAMAQSHVRNALRRLVALGLVEQVGRGTYKPTDKAIEIFGQAA